MRTVRHPRPRRASRDRRFYRRCIWRAAYPLAAAAAILGANAAHGATLTNDTLGSGSSYSIFYYQPSIFGASPQSTGFGNSLTGGAALSVPLFGETFAPFATPSPSAGVLSFNAAGSAWVAGLTGTPAADVINTFLVQLAVPGASFDSLGLLKNANTNNATISTEVSGPPTTTGTDFVLFGTSAITGTLTVTDVKTGKITTAVVNDPAWNGAGEIGGAFDLTGGGNMALTVTGDNLTETFAGALDGFNVTGNLSLVNGTTNLSLAACSVAAGTASCDPEFSTDAPPPPPPPIQLGGYSGPSTTAVLGLGLLVTGFLANRRRRQQARDAWQEPTAEDWPTGGLA